MHATMALSCCIALLCLLATIAIAELERVSFNFADFEENLQDLSLLGDAKFVRIEGQADGMAVQLSGTRENTVGRLLYSYAIRMLDGESSASFATQFCFSMASYAGDGLAFIVAPDRTKLGASGPWLGLVDGANRTRSEHTFAVEFDSVMNQELLDPNSNHVGVDVETILSTATANASDVSLVLNDGARKCAWVQYDASNSELEVRIAADPLASQPPPRPVAPLMKHKLQLASIWKPWMYVGFSSSTGDASQKHKLFSWKFSSGSSNSMQEILQQLERQVEQPSQYQEPPPQLLQQVVRQQVEQFKHKLLPLPRQQQVQVGNDDQQHEQEQQQGEQQEQLHRQWITRQHSMPADPSSSVPPQGDGGSDSGQDDDSSGTKFDAGVLVLLLVGFTCGACIALFLLVGWALMLRKSSDAATAAAAEYEELS